MPRTLVVNFFILLHRYALLGLILGAMVKPTLAASDPFPSYSCIQPNVAFWKKVYAEYPSSRGLIHDSQNLAIIYEVVTLEGDDSAGYVQTNERLITAAKEKYRQLLSSLAQGRTPASLEEKRVAALFGPDLQVDTLQVAVENVRFQRCLSDRFQAGLIRSGRYFEQIKGVFSQYGLPSDLAYLPHVESSYDYQAYSKAGAAGIWQLMRDTGKRFLTINAAIDERRDPLLASHAAAKFLRGNYKKLESWPLALTAYNHGLTAVLRAKNSLGAYEKIYQEYDGPRFGFASRNFYAEFLAAREITKNYQKHFKDLRLDHPVQTREITINNAIGIKDVAGQFKIDIPTLAALNPALLPPVWDGRKYVPKGYTLRLPKTTMAREGTRLTTLPLSPTRPPARLKAKPSHQVKPGDTITAIARRYRVSARELIAYNRLGGGSVLQVGQKLQIPVANEQLSSTKQKINL